MQAYRDAMKWFVILAMFIFLGVMYYLPVLRYFISPKYFSGLDVVPVIMIAEFFFGVFFNLSLWYKLTDRTHWGMWFSLLGLGVTVALNVLLVPRMGYMGCAYAALGCYTVMMVASYFAGRRFYPIGYEVGRMSCYFVLALALYGAGRLVELPHQAATMGVRTLLLCVYAVVVLKVERVNFGQLFPIKKILHRR